MSTISKNLIIITNSTSTSPTKYYKRFIRKDNIFLQNPIYIIHCHNETLKIFQPYHQRKANTYTTCARPPRRVYKLPEPPVTYTGSCAAVPLARVRSLLCSCFFLGLVPSAVAAVCRTRARSGYFSLLVYAAQHLASL